MICVKPRYDLWEPGPKPKTFSYSEVENLLYELVLNIDNLELMHENNIELTPMLDSKDRRIRVFVKQGQKAEQLFFNLEDR